jgi:hypothetical protein
MALPTGIKRLALVTAAVLLVATMATVMFAGPSLAASQPARAVLTAQGSPLHVQATLANGLHVRKRPTTAATAVAVLGPAGSRVDVNCFAFGSSVFGDSVWYHIVHPFSGFVAGFYLDTGRDPAPGIPACSSHRHRHIYHTLANGLHVRTAPTTAAATIVLLAGAGSKVTVNCYAIGSPVFGDSVWYHIVKPLSGFVAGFYLGTGRDPAPGIGHC